MADDNFLTRLLSSLTPEPFDPELDEKAYQLAGGDSNPTAQRDTKAIADRLRDERNKAPIPSDDGFVRDVLMKDALPPFNNLKSPEPKLDNALPSDGDLVRNILMKGVIPQSNVPNFSAGKDPMWFSPQGPIRPNQMPPSPLKPEIQEQMMAAAAKQNTTPPGMPQAPAMDPDMPMQARSMASSPKSSQQAKASLPAPPMPQVSPSAPKEDDHAAMLKKLIDASTDDKELRSAMEEQKRREAIGMMLRGVAGIGAGMSGQSSAKVEDSYMKDYMDSGKTGVANAREFMKNKQEKIKFAVDTEKGMIDLSKAKLGFADEKMARDPKSKTSELARESIRDALAGINKKGRAANISEDMSARQLEDRFGEFNIQNMVTSYEAQQNRLAMEKERTASRKDSQETKRIDKKDSNVMSLRKELTSGNVGKVHANYLNAERNERIISDFAKNPTGYSDYGTLMGSLKTLQGDESVVREAEIKLGQQAGTLSQQIKNMVDGKIKGTSLQPAQRQAILTAVGILKTRARQQYQETIEPVLQQADNMGVERSELLPKNMQQKELNKSSPFDTNAAKAELERRKKVK